MAEITIEITTTISGANGSAETYTVRRGYHVGDNPGFLEDECDKALTKTAGVQRENLAGRFSRTAFGNVPA